MDYIPGFRGTVLRGWTNLSLRAKGLLVFSVPVVALLVSATLLVRLDREKTDAEQRVKRALDMRAQLQNLYIVLISAESEVRNYGLNGQEDGLQPFGLAAASIDAVFGRVKDLIQDNAAQKARLAQVQQLGHSRLNGLADLRRHYQSAESRSHPTPPELIARAKISPDVILAVNEFATEESKLIQERTKVDGDRQMYLREGVYASAAIALLGGVLSILLFTGGIARRMRRLERNASRLAEGLPSDSPFPGADELGRLARAIEKAGSVIAARSDELNLALEGGEVLIWDLDPKSGKILYHAGADKTKGVFPKELHPETVDAWIAVVHSDDRERVERELNRIALESGTLQIEYRVIVRGGAIRWMVVNAKSHLLSTGERRLLGVLADITARKAASEEIERQARELIASREALQNQTRILQSILDSMGDGVVVADPEGNFLVFNPAAREMLGVRSFGREADQWARHHGLFLPDTVTVYPPDQLPFVRAIRGESVDDAEIFVRPVGAAEGTWVSVTARPLRGEAGANRGGVVVIRNITASKHAAEALELAKREAETANQAKSEFLSRMSHELRTPLNSILGFAQLLELGNLGEQASDNVYHILKGGYHLLDLINEILDLARIESGRLAISSEAVPMREALKDALDLVRPLAIERHVTISPEIALRCNHHVYADRQRLKQVLLNLLSNAIKFNRPGGSVVLSCEEIESGRLRIEVIDTGSGISPEGLKRIFTPFERLDADGTEAGGTGLGLALSKRLMEAMGGTIGVESAVGFGSKFFIDLSMIEDPSATLENDAAAEVLIDSTRGHQRGTVLYIEDNSSNLRLVERIFAHRPGVRLLSALEGRLGLDLADLHTPDWILLDLHLPDVSGEEVLRRLRANPRTVHIPVTILSADATPGQMNRLMEAGARDYLTKPLDVRKFIHLLERTIAGSGSNSDQTRTEYAERNHSE
jgi:signal transduction histidine kinase/CheY-like chemotaxis protein/CHASE3 domain sensor protein